jgi:predicted transcriptional regulator
MAQPRNTAGRADHGELQRDVIAVVLRLGRCTVRQVHTELAPTRPLAYTTVLTVMTRLAERGVLRRDTEGKAGVFSAATSSDRVAAGLMVDQLLSRFGYVAVAEFVARAKHDPELTDQLRQLLSEETDAEQ